MQTKPLHRHALGLRVGKNRHFSFDCTINLLGYKSKHLWTRNWNYSMAFVICSIVIGENAPEYDTRIKRGRFRPDNLVKDENFIQPNGSERRAQPSQLSFENTPPVKDWVPSFTLLCNKQMIYYLIVYFLHFNYSKMAQWSRVCAVKVVMAAFCHTACPLSVSLSYLLTLSL